MDHHYARIAESCADVLLGAICLVVCDLVVRYTCAALSDGAERPVDMWIDGSNSDTVSASLVL